VQIEQTHAVRNCCAALANLLSDVFLPQPEFSCQPGERHGLFDRIQVLTLKIFNQRQLQDVLVGGFADDDRGFSKPNPARSPPAAFPGDQLVFVSAAADDQRLDNSMLFDRVDEFLKVLVAKYCARFAAASARSG
jgi:hypothetical protein